MSSQYPAAEKMLRSLLRLRGYEVVSIDVGRERASIEYRHPEESGIIEGTPAQLAKLIAALPDRYAGDFRADLKAMQRGG